MLDATVQIAPRAARWATDIPENVRCPRAAVYGDGTAVTATSIMLARALLLAALISTAGGHRVRCSAGLNLELVAFTRRRDGNPGWLQALHTRRHDLIDIVVGVVLVVVERDEPLRVRRDRDITRLFI